MAWFNLTFRSKKKSARWRVMALAPARARTPNPRAPKPKNGRVRSSKPRVRLNQRLKKYAALLCWICVVGAVLAGVGLFGRELHRYLLHADYFALRHCRVFGAGPNLERELTALYVQPEKRPNLLSLDLRRLESQLRHHPRILKARADRIPPHTLRIRVTERKPVAIVACGELFLIDRDCMVIDTLTPDEREYYDLPFVTGVNSYELSTGDCIGSLHSAAVRSISETILHLNRANPELGQRVSEYAIGEDSAVTMRLRAGPLVLFGDVHPLKRMADLETFLQDDERSQCEYVDLRFSKQVVYMPKK